MSQFYEQGLENFRKKKGRAKSRPASPYEQHAEMAISLNKLSPAGKRRIAMLCPKWKSVLDISKEMEVIKLQKFPERWSGFGRLPAEILTKIFQNLALADKKNLRLVCPRWRVLVDSGMNFHVVLDKSALDWLKYFHKEFERNTMRNSSTDLVLRKINLPPVIKLTIGSGSSSQGIVEFLTYFSDKVTSLTLLNYCFSHNTCGHSCVRSIVRMGWRLLGALSLSFGTRRIKSIVPVSSAEHIESMILFLKNVRTANLTHLTINFDYAGKLGSDNKRNAQKKPYLEVLAFIVKHKTSLQDLNLSLIGSCANSAKDIFSEKLLLEFSTSHIERFSIKFDSYNCNIALCLIKNINPVKSLQVHCTDWTWASSGYKSGQFWSISADTKVRLGQLMKKHGNTLESLDVRTSYPSKIENLLMPYTHTPLTKVILFIKVLTFQSDIDVILHFLGTASPRVVHLELMVFKAQHNHPVFTRDHLRSILRLSKLKKLKIGPGRNADLVKFCDELTQEGILTYKRRKEHIKTHPDDIGEYDLLDFQIHKPLPRLEWV